MILTEIFLIAISGLLATLGMALFFHLIRIFKFSSANIVCLLESFFTESEKNESSSIAWFFHFLFGVIFAFIYALVLKIIPGIIKYSASYLAAGTVLGFVHGLIFSLIVIILVAEHHPVKKYREQGFGGAIYYFIAHIIYGLTFGLCYMTFIS